MEQLAIGLAQHGLPGLIIAALLYWVNRLQNRLDLERDERLKEARLYAQDLTVERNARLQDAKEYADKTAHVHELVHTTVDKVSDVLNIITAGPNRGSKHD